jgi:hypothetical protein
MKNILAENMLRFGVKNLKESDIKKIEESLLTEAFTDKNGQVWPLFKDQKSVDMLNNIAIDIVDSSNSPIYTAVFGPAQDQYGKDNPNGGSASANLRMGTNSPAEFIWIYWHIQALTPTRTAFSIPRDMSDVMRTTFNSVGYAKTENYVRNIGSSYSVIDVKDALLNPDNIKWWNTLIEYPKGTKNLTRWQLFSQTYLQPGLAKLQPLVVKPTAPVAATPGMTPGAKSVPGKQ